MKLQKTTILHTLCCRLLFRFSWILFFTIIALPAISQQSDIQNLRLRDVTTQKDVSLSDYKSKSGVVLIFFCNDCPYSIYYINRIKDLGKSYKDTQFLLINSSNSEFAPEESEINMLKFLKKHAWEIPYIIDKDKTVMKKFGAKKCPEAFVVSTRDWKVEYYGAIDNNPQVAADANQNHLKKVLDQMILGATVSVTHQRPTGCIIK